MAHEEIREVVKGVRGVHKVPENDSLHSLAYIIQYSLLYESQGDQEYWSMLIHFCYFIIIIIDILIL